MVGPFLSTRLPATGPALVQLPTASQTTRLSVEAFESSVPAGTLVESEKLASPAFASPEPPSVAAQAICTSVACQAPSALAHEAEGAFLSTLLPLTGPAFAQLPARSQTVRLSVEALAVSVPAATCVESRKLASAGSARPEPVSLAVHWMEMSVECQRPSGEPHVTVGGVVSAAAAGPSLAMKGWKPVLPAPQ